MPFRLFLILSLLLGAACGPSDPSSVEAEIQTDATIRWQEIEGGFFGIVADDGSRYDPVNLSAVFRQDGMRVRIEATPSNGPNIHMWGTPIEILSIRALDPVDALLFVDAVHDPSNCPQGVFRCRTVTINYDVLDNSIAAGLGSTIKINPFEDSVFEAVLTFSEIDTHEVPVRKTWLGTIAGQQFSSVLFTYRVQQHLVGSVTCPWTYPRNYLAIRRIPGSGRHLVLETDPRDPPQD